MQPNKIMHKQQANTAEQKIMPKKKSINESYNWDRQPKLSANLKISFPP
jgi:hypothetical protein